MNTPDDITHFSIEPDNVLPPALASIVSLPWPLKRKILTTPSLWRIYRGICLRLGWNAARLGWYTANNGPYSGIRLHATHINLLWAPVGGYEPWVSRWLVKLLTERRWGCFAKDVWDVGAYRGYLSLLCSKYGQGQIVSFEPDETNRAQLMMHMRANPTLSSRIEVLPVAASNTDGFIDFLSREVGLVSQGKLPGVQIYEDGGTANLTRVRSVRLDSLIDEGRRVPGLVKIDVEGAETLTLLGARTLLNTGRPVVLLETHGQTAYESCTELLKQCRYKLSFINGDRLRELPGCPMSYGHVLAIAQN